MAQWLIAFVSLKENPSGSHLVNPVPGIPTVSVQAHVYTKKHANMYIMQISRHTFKAQNKIICIGRSYPGQRDSLE